MAEVRVDIEGDAVIGHPAPHADADRGDLGLAGAVANPDADAALAALALYAELRQGADPPILEVIDKAVHVEPAAG